VPSAGEKRTIGDVWVSAEGLARWMASFSKVPLGESRPVVSSCQVFSKAAIVGGR